MVPCAFLRVYQPLDAFERSEQLHWERFLLNGRPRRARVRLRYADHPTVGKLGVLAPATPIAPMCCISTGARLSARAGCACVCSRRWSSFRETRSIELWDQFVPKKEGKRAASDLARLRRRDPSAVAFCHQSPGTCRSGGSCSSATTNASSPDRPTEGGDFATAPRRASAMRRAEQAIRSAPSIRPRPDRRPHPRSASVDGAVRSCLDPRARLRGPLRLPRWDELDDDHSARATSTKRSRRWRPRIPESRRVYQGVLTRWAECADARS